MSNNMLLPTTEVYDVGSVYSLDVNSSEFRELLVRLVTNSNAQNIIINNKDSGVHSVLETITCKTYPTLDPAAPNLQSRASFRKFYNFGALLNAAPKTLAHGLTLNADLMVTSLTGVAADLVNNIYLPLPYSSPVLASNIELQINGNNIIVTPGSDRTAFTQTYIVVEYLKY